MNDEILFVTEDQLADLAPAEEAIDSQKFLIFLCDGLRLGVVAEWVVEILTNLPITYLPMMPDYIPGIINMRGQIIPIVDVRLRLRKLPEADEQQKSNLINVLNIEGTQLGILVDAVDQMIDIPKENILPMPAHSQQLLVSGMCSLPDDSGTMMVLDCGQLMPHD